MTEKGGAGTPKNDTTSDNSSGVAVLKPFGEDGRRHVYFEMLTFKGFQRWRRAHEGDSRYSVIIDSITLIDSPEAVYRATWSIYWNDADATGAIRILPEDERIKYYGVRGRRDKIQTASKAELRRIRRAINEYLEG